MHRRAFVGYVALVFLIEIPEVFLSAPAAASYLTVALLVMGAAAIVCQKAFHHERFVDMGFRLNRNALIGVVIGLLSTGFVLAIDVWLPVKLS